MYIHRYMHAYICTYFCEIFYSEESRWRLRKIYLYEPNDSVRIVNTIFFLLKIVLGKCLYISFQHPNNAY
jgi:hypothetical protein